MAGTDDKDREQAEADEKSATEDLKQGLMHLFTAARKVVKQAEPTVNHAFDDAERVIGKIGRGGGVLAAEVGKEVASLATRLAERIKTVAERVEGDTPDERTPPPPPRRDDESDDDDRRR